MTAKITPETIIAAAQSNPGTAVIIATVDDYPHAKADKTGEMAARWLDRQRRSVARVAAVQGVLGKTRVEDGTATFTVAPPAPR